MSNPAEVLRRARREADRYGADPWVFLRELVQNARDAGAARVVLTTGVDAGVERVSCSDDGAGMSAALVEEGLLRLFSSKKQLDGAAGQFGVGFWSVLRFDPSVVRVDTHDGKGAVGLVVDVRTGEVTEVASARQRRGTTVTLERSAREPYLQQRVKQTTQRMCGCITGLTGRPPPVITVDGADVKRDMLALFEKGDPQVAVSGDGFRGAVGFGRRPRIEIYVHGLLVKEALSLDELLPSRGRRRGFAAGLFPVAAIEAPGVTLLLDRMEVVEDALVRRLVEHCEEVLAKLLKELLDELVPLPWWRRALSSFARHGYAVLATAMLVPLGLGLGLAVAHALHVDGGAGGFFDFGGAPPARPAALVEDLPGSSAPRVDDLVADRGAAGFAVTVSTREPFLFLRLGVLDVLDERRGLVARDPPAPPRPSPPTDGELVADVWLVARAARTPLPVAPGTAVEGVALEDGRGLSFLERAPVEEVVHYRLVRVAERIVPPVIAPVALPRELEDEAARLRSLPPRQRIGAAAGWVRARLRYEADRKTRDAIDGAGGTFFERVLAVGAGDCDVVNAVLVALLAKSGVNARLATGLVVQSSVVAPLQHAWVEAFVDDLLIVADGSTPVFFPGGAPAADAAPGADPGADPGAALLAAAHAGAPAGAGDDDGDARARGAPTPAGVTAAAAPSPSGGGATGTANGAGSNGAGSNGAGSNGAGSNGAGSNGATTTRSGAAGAGAATTASGAAASGAAGAAGAGPNRAATSAGSNGAAVGSGGVAATNGVFSAAPANARDGVIRALRVALAAGGVATLVLLAILAARELRRRGARPSRVDLTTLFVQALMRGERSDPLGLWHRRLLPRHRGGPLSLRQAERLAARGLLGVSRSGDARVRRGASVLVRGDARVDAIRPLLFGLADLDDAAAVLARPPDGAARALAGVVALVEPRAEVRVVPGRGVREIPLPLVDTPLLVTVGDLEDDGVALFTRTSSLARRRDR